MQDLLGFMPPFRKGLILALFLVPSHGNAQQISEGHFPALTGMLGGSVLEYTFAGDKPFHGAAARFGVSLSPLIDVTALGELWAIEDRGPTWSTHLEATYFPMGRPRLAPLVFLSGGYFRSDAPTPDRATFSGTSAAIGVGARLRTWNWVVVQLEGLLRTDVGGGSDEVRAFVGWAPGDLAPEADVDGSTIAAVAYQMIPLRGPWRFRGLGYAARFSTPITSRYSVGLGIGIMHLRMIHESLPDRYTWDTRSALVLPGAIWQRSLGPTEISLRLGPAATAMIEGPDAGARFGAHSEVSVSVEPGGIPVTFGAGSFWIARPNDQGGALPGEDMAAFTLFAGIGK